MINKRTLVNYGFVIFERCNCLGVFNLISYQLIRRFIF